MTAGIYTCTITDANACTSALSFTITQPTAITNTATSIDVECNGGNTGSASISISGGTTPYTVTWQSGASGTTLTSLAAGTYNYSITDGNGCLETGSAIVGQPSTLVAAITSTDALCHGESNGTLDASATGGIAPYSYSWNHTTDISSTLSNQSAGSYTCVITDANGCTSTQSVIISEPTTLATTTTQTDVTCNGGNNGIAEITATGGTAPYNYTWNHSSDNVSSFNDLSNGNYQCLITDANGCTTNASFVITEPTAITSTNSTIEPLCNGGTGEASIIASGGTGNLSYNWSNGTTASFDNNLSAGNYTVVITDDNGCSYSTSINITEPTAVQLTITTTDPLCHSGDGSAMVTATGGTGAYTYDWSTGGNTDTESAIYAGSYSLTITDNNGCAYTQNFSIADPAAISTSFTTVSPLCNGGTGEATINASGGTGNLNIQWSSGGTATTESNLSAGVYQVQVMDDNGCLENSSVTISEPAAITYQATVNDEHCNQGNGSISVTATGGTGVLSYNWNTGSSDYEITSLSAGTFDFTIYDQNGCTIMNQVTLNNISAPTVSSSTNNVSCNSDANGTIDISVSGGTAVYNYTWSNGATTEDLSQLIAGTYDYTVTDDANCTTTGSITISEPNALATTATSINETSGNDGSIDLSVTGGTAPYSYTWSNGENSEDISGLTAGNYVVNITDANGCNTSTSIDITSTVGLFQLTGSATQLIVKPNPSNGMLNIEGLSIGDCKIYDAAGRLIKSFANNSTEIKIDLTSLANGVYSIRNFSEKGNNIGRIIISK